MLLRLGIKLEGQSSSTEYEVEHFIGNGMNGEVYRVLDLRDKITKAIKVSSDELMLEREADAARKIRHQNVARYYEYRKAEIDSSVMHYIVMEYLPNGDLRKKVEGRKKNGGLFPIELLISWMHQLASGLSAVNEVLIHRDLKPENCLFVGETLKISDFGLSKYIDEVTRTQTYKGEGTYPYMAPETWELGHQSTQTDIYSLGIIFYELITLERPFEAENWLNWSQQHRFTLPPHVLDKNPQIGYVIDGMVRRMMEKEPSKRYQSADEIIQVLSSISSAGKQPARVPDSLVNTARQKFDHESEKVQAEKLEEDRKNEQKHKFIYSFQELEGTLDGLVHEINGKIQVKQIEKRVVETGMWLPSRRIQYTYYEKSLHLDMVYLMEAFDKCNKNDKNLLEEKGIIGAARLCLSYRVESRQGINFVLLLEQGKMYGSWKTCEIRDHAFSGERHVYQPFGVSDAQTLVHDIIMYWRNVMDTHTVTIKDFTIDDFIPFLQELVS
jgi:serine/threonine protein kinase